MTSLANSLPHFSFESTELIARMEACILTGMAAFFGFGLVALLAGV